MDSTPQQGIFRDVAIWRNLRFFQKSEVLYHMTVCFCERFLPKYGDRTVDQMVQAARSGKQNIVEGSEDGKTSTELELKLLNVARASFGELRQDYLDYLKSHNLKVWADADQRFNTMLEFAKANNKLSQYEPYFSKWTAEEMANLAITLCYQVDSMMNKYLKNLEGRFITEGGVKERMHRERTGYRKKQEEELAELKQLLAESKEETAKWQKAYDDLRQRALKAYQEQQAEIEALRKQLQGKH